MATRQTQDRILDAAIELFNEFATSEVSTNRVATVCELSRGNLHYHFQTKKQIIQSVFQRMTKEVDAAWYSDHLRPTLEHMAEMFARHSLLVYRYRFFYREMPDLLRSDPLLMQRYLEYRQRRIRVVELFFLELDRRGVAQMQGNLTLIKSLVESTWVLSDNWLNSAWALESEISGQTIVRSYSAILDILRPYMSADVPTVMHLSEAAILGHVRSCNTLTSRDVLTTALA
ncbi:MAG: TetR/AcrR family transcriptional regulator [Steroidobacteraceae bacterium]